MKSGDARVALIGFPSVGKVSVNDHLTTAQPHYNFHEMAQLISV